MKQEDIRLSKPFDLRLCQKNDRVNLISENEKPVKKGPATMETTEMILNIVQKLPEEKRQEVLDFADFLEKRLAGPLEFRDPECLWANLNVQITDEDISEARKEMWRSFPREDAV